MLWSLVEGHASLLFAYALGVPEVRIPPHHRLNVVARTPFAPAADQIRAGAGVDVLYLDDLSRMAPYGFDRMDAVPTLANGPTFDC